MHRKIWMFVVLVTAGPAIAEEGYRDSTNYRMNDPFVFCTRGQIVPDKCWGPLDPITGTYWMNPDCDPPNTETGRIWSVDDNLSLLDYQRICPHAMKTGDWKGAGTGEQVPTIH